MTDIESDFWKDKLVHMTHKNMMRMNAEKLCLADCKKEYVLFAERHPEIKTEITDASGYSTWEAFVTPEIKLRIFVQNQVKVTILQKSKNDLIKLADAKFPNNPFPEVDEFLAHISSYEQELKADFKTAERFTRQQKLACEFIKAYLNKKIPEGKIIWSLTQSSDCFKLSLEYKIAGKTEQKISDIHIENFDREIDCLLEQILIDTGI